MSLKWVALADLIKDIKVVSNLWMKESGKFPDFTSWQDGYGAFTYNIRDRDKIIDYVKKQKEHHKRLLIDRSCININ